MICFSLCSFFCNLFKESVRWACKVCLVLGVVGRGLGFCCG